MRPPQRSRASSIVTRLPARASSRAVISPAAPAPTTTKCVRCRAAAGITMLADCVPGVSVDLGAFGGHRLLHGGTRQHALAVLHDPRQFAGVDTVAFDPGSDREEVRIADRVQVTHDPWTLEELLLDQLKALGHVRRYFAFHRLDGSIIIGP